MYVPHAFREEEREALLAFVRRHAFATLVTVADGTPLATHLPLVVAEAGEGLVLHGHLARANPQWRAFGAGDSLAIFSGPHAYVSPRHYDRRESVPTWNYLAVHAYGPARIVDDPDAIEAHLLELSAAYEPGYPRRWEELSERYREGMKGGLVAFELPVTRVEGAAKLSQNKTPAERARIAAALLASEDADARATGEEMRSRLPPEPDDG